MYLSRCLEQKKKLYLLRCATNSLAKSLCALLWNKNGAVLRVYPWSYDAYKSIPDWSDINWSECSMFSHNQELMQVLTQWGTTPATNKQKWHCKIMNLSNKEHCGTIRWRQPFIRSITTIADAIVDSAAGHRHITTSARSMSAKYTNTFSYSINGPTNTFKFKLNLIWNVQ